MNKRIIIIGAGPTGIGAAWRLWKLDYDNWHLYERSNQVGGLAGSVKTAGGFTWDYGGHVIFSHYRPFDEMLEETLGEQVLQHERQAWVRIFGRWVPYPFQNNIRYLPNDVLIECLLGLAEVYKRPRRTENFEQFILSTFGTGIAKHFMLPYNRKVWAVHPREMDYGWIGERVSVPDVFRVLRAVCTGQDDVSWGPNNRFRFPRRGGTGAIWQALGGRLAAGDDAARCRFFPELRGLALAFDHARILADAGFVVEAQPG